MAAARALASSGDALGVATGTMLAVGTMLSRRVGPTAVLLLCIDETDGRTLAAALAAHIAGTAVVNACGNAAAEEKGKMVIAQLYGAVLPSTSLETSLGCGGEAEA